MPESGRAPSGSKRPSAFHAGSLPADGRMDDPRVLRIRDAYLEPFTRRGSRKEQCWVALARRTGCVTRAISWESARRDAPGTVVAAEESQSEDGCLSCSSRGPMWTNAAAPREKDALRRGR
jgi:hypothetical protein